MGLDSLKGKCCLITGGAGVIGEAIARALASYGINIAILDMDGEKSQKLASALERDYDIIGKGYSSNVLDKSILNKNLKEILNDFNSFDFLINGAGGNSPKATTSLEEILPETEESDFEKSFFGLEVEGFQHVFNLNFLGTLLPSMVFGKHLITRKSGAIVNISSMNSYRPLTKIPAYSAAKASVNNFTEWLSTHFAKTGVRVNAIAPGFILTNQNRFLLIDKETEGLTERGNKIISNTPMGRFGEPEEMTGTVAYLLSDLAAFITGVTIPIDGGFSAYSGV